jgi:hypothetical protein
VVLLMQFRFKCTVLLAFGCLNAHAMDFPANLTRHRSDPVSEFAWHAVTAPAAVHTAVTQLEGYAAWARAHFTEAELADAGASAPEADYLGDGLSNAVKYALSYGPADECPEALGETSQFGEHWFFHFYRGADIVEVDFRVEVSTDLANWSSDGVTEQPLLANDLAEAWQAHFQAAPGDQVWFRLAATVHATKP